MASLVITPNPCRVGQSPTIVGEGFAASTPVAVRVQESGFQAEIGSNAGGLVSNDDMGDHATGTLTAAANPINNETVTIGSRVYTLKTTLTGAANEIALGGTASITLDNIKAAVNGAAGAGTLYGTGTVAHADVVAGAKTATTIAFHARVAGTDGNSIATTETSAAGLSFGGGALTGGAADPTGVKLMDWTPTRPGTFTVTATDGTNTATARVMVHVSP